MAEDERARKILIRVSTFERRLAKLSQFFVPRRSSGQLAVCVPSSSSVHTEGLVLKPMWTAAPVFFLCFFFASKSKFKANRHLRRVL